MSRSGNLILGLLSAASFYFLFGFAFPKYFAPQAASSIAPAIQIVVTTLSVAVAAKSLFRFFRTDSK